MKKEDLKKGMVVTYIPKNCKNKNEYEVGKVLGWNEIFVFVDYDNTNRGQATEIDQLKKGDHTIYNG